MSETQVHACRIATIDKRLSTAIYDTLSRSQTEMGHICHVISQTNL